MSHVSTLLWMTAAVWAAAAGSTLAQDPPASATTEDMAAPAAAPAAAPEWHVFSRSSDRAYLVDLGTAAEAEGARTVQVARVSRKNAAGNYSHSVEGYSLRCSAGQVKLGETVEYDAAGSEADRYDDGADWEDIRTGSVDEYVKMQVCDGQRSSPPTYPSIRAFIDAGRGN